MITLDASMTLVCVNNDEDGVEAWEGDRRLLRDASQVRLAEAEAGGQGGVVAPEVEDRLPQRVVGADEQAAVWWLGAHGGAGESTLEELFSGSRAAGHSWPVAAAGEPPVRVVLVARTHAHGLRAAQRAIREWAAGEVQVLLLGLVLMADAPGRLPRRLRELAGLVAGGVPAVWPVPWIEAWRVGEPPGPGNAPKVVGRLLEELRAMTEAAASVNANRKDEE
jgi:hypothetical protein